MLGSFTNFHKYLCNNKIKVSNSYLNAVLQEYSFYSIPQLFDDSSILMINQNLKESFAIIIDQCIDKYRDDNYFIISFKKTLIVINQISVPQLKSLFVNNSILPIYYLHNAKNEFNKNIDFEIENSQNECDISIDSMKEFLIIPNQNHLLCQIWENICPSLVGYLIQQCYEKINQRQAHISFAIDNSSKKQLLSNDEYIEIGNKGIGSIFKTELIYHIKEEEIFLIKKPNKFDKETSKLLEREINNYLSFNYPLLPKMHGIIKNNNEFYPVIQLINGQELIYIENIHLNENEKISIIFQIIIIINYFHRKKFIYRDLKPSNIIIDQNKNAFIIDFDRIIKKDDIEPNKMNTVDFGTHFIAPEISNGTTLFKSDIYSIGQLIYYIINEKLPNDKDAKEKLFSKSNKNIEIIYKICTENNAKNRPTSSKLIFIYIIFYPSQINSILLQKDPELKKIQDIINNKYNYISDITAVVHHLLISLKKNAQYIYNIINLFWNALIHNKQEEQYGIGLLYIESQYFAQDIDKAIHYFTLAANQNHPNAQFYLGKIYFMSIYNKYDINKSIHYLTLAANQNDSQAQLYLFIIYYNGKYIKKNINKALYYLSLSANQNNREAQYNLGLFYLDGIYFSKDINKAIHYLSLAANQNMQNAQIILSKIFCLCPYIKKDINKSIHYLTLAANQNNPQAQYYLFSFYYEGSCIKKDIDKAIYYLTLSAHQGYPDSQFNLGVIYLNGIYFAKDINKAIHYLSLAANQNMQNAQLILGIFFYEGEYVKKDINKSIHYLTLAANQNNPQAQYNLFCIYYEGSCNKKDIDKAIYYLTLSAYQGYPDSQFNLGVFYLKGIYFAKDINKAIHYLSLAANQNHLDSQIYISDIYLKGFEVAKNINKAIYFLTLAEKQKSSLAQVILGNIFSLKKYKSININKAIHYYSLAAKQNDPNAQYELGRIYYNAEYIDRDINKAIYFLSLAAKQNLPQANAVLGYIYLKGDYVSQNIDKSIYYYTIAANQNERNAQLALGMIYLLDINNAKRIDKGIDLIIQSAYQGNIQAHFIAGYFYHVGIFIAEDIRKSIYHYKEASCFNNKYAKNNLGILYKNGFGKEVSQQIGSAIEYFKESIRLFNDEVSMYNLSHIYIYIYKTDDKINESIELLIRSYNLGFSYSIDLLCIALTKKYGLNIEMIKQELFNKTNSISKLPFKISQMILDSKYNFGKNYKIYENIDFLYDFRLIPVRSNQKFDKAQNLAKNKLLKDITPDFYEGFYSR